MALVWSPSVRCALPSFHQHLQCSRNYCRGALWLSRPMPVIGDTPGTKQCTWWPMMIHLTMAPPSARSPGSSDFPQKRRTPLAMLRGWPVRRCVPWAHAFPVPKILCSMSFTDFIGIARAALLVTTNDTPTRLWTPTSGVVRGECPSSYRAGLPCPLVVGIPQVDTLHSPQNVAPVGESGLGHGSEASVRGVSAAPASAIVPQRPFSPRLPRSVTGGHRLVSSTPVGLDLSWATENRHHKSSAKRATNYVD